MLTWQIGDVKVTRVVELEIPVRQTPVPTSTTGAPSPSVAFTRRSPCFH